MALPRRWLPPCRQKQRAAAPPDAPCPTVEIDRPCFVILLEPSSTVASRARPLLMPARWSYDVSLMRNLYAIATCLCKRLSSNSQISKSKQCFTDSFASQECCYVNPNGNDIAGVGVEVNRQGEGRVFLIHEVNSCCIHCLQHSIHSCVRHVERKAYNLKAAIRTGGGITDSYLVDCQDLSEVLNEVILLNLAKLFLEAAEKKLSSTRPHTLDNYDGRILEI